MIELDGYPYPSFATFDGQVIERFSGRPDKAGSRWHVRFIKSISLVGPDRQNLWRVTVEMDIVGKLGFAVAAEQRPAAEAFVAAVQQEIARRGHF